MGGSYANAPSYEYTVGPDGKRYATSGEVKIDSSPIRDNPKATIRKMEIVVRAALGPAQPSSQDLQVARQAQQERSKAQAQITKQQEQEQDKDGNLTSQSKEEFRKATAAYAQAANQIDPATSSVVVVLGEQLFATA